MNFILYGVFLKFYLKEGVIMGFFFNKNIKNLFEQSSRKIVMQQRSMMRRRK
jgi:hypothetical protein